LRDCLRPTLDRFPAGTGVEGAMNRIAEVVVGRRAVALGGGPPGNLRAVEGFPSVTVLCHAAPSMPSTPPSSVPHARHAAAAQGD
jgi:hypothetical protein